jgi:CheY-like chemotaxis protein
MTLSTIKKANDRGIRVLKRKRETALKRIDSENYQLIITDLIMPGMDGTELCERIKGIRPDVKVYALSGHIELYDGDKLEKLGFDGTIKKPVSMREMKETIESAVGIPRIAKSGRRT